MKDYPQNAEQWASEAYQSLKLAWVILIQTNPVPNDKQKEELIVIAVKLACENRDVADESYLQHAKEYAVEEFKLDYDSRDVLAKVNFSLCFLLAYFDAHLSLSLIEKPLVNDAMAHLRANYDLNYTGEAQTNAFSVSYSSKKL